MSLIRVLNSVDPDFDLHEIHDEIEPLLLQGEKLLTALKAVRHKVLFTGMRMIFIDRPEASGRKVENLTVPYGAIVSFSMESAGVEDVDAALNLWIKDRSDPLVFEFRADESAIDVYRILSEVVLG